MTKKTILMINNTFGTNYIYKIIKKNRKIFVIIKESQSCGYRYWVAFVYKSYKDIDYNYIFNDGYKFIPNVPHTGQIVNHSIRGCFTTINNFLKLKEKI